MASGRSPTYSQLAINYLKEGIQFANSHAAQ